MIIITGGAGFIGSNTAHALGNRRTVPIVISDWFEEGTKWKNLLGARIDDVVPPEQLLEFLDSNAGSISALVHMGAISSTTATDIDLIVRNNIVLTRTLWDWCTEHHVPFIYASSAATYGDGKQGFDDFETPEELLRLRPLNAYGWSKHVCDMRIARIVAAGGRRPPQWVGLKFFNVYGPREDHKADMKSVIAKIEPLVAASKTVHLFKSHHPDYSDGGQMRDFIFVEDCVDVIAWAIDTPSVSGLFNVGTGQARPFRALAEAVFSASNREPKIEYVDTPPAIRDKYQYFTQANVGKLRAAGYERPFTSLEDGVRKYVHAWLATQDR